MFLAVSLHSIVLLLALNFPHSVTSQCAAYNPNRVSSSTFDTVFSVTPKIITGSGVGCFGVSGRSVSSLCVYEIQGSSDQVIDVQIHSFTTMHGTLSVIDGSGLFGGTYRRTVQLPATFLTSLVTTSATNTVGIVVDTAQHNIVAAGPAYLSFQIYYKIRTPAEAVLTSPGTPSTCTK